MKVKETKIPIGGVLRCCLAEGGLFFRPELEEECEVGNRRHCRYCNEEFVLTVKKEWVPTWSLSHEKG